MELFNGPHDWRKKIILGNLKEENLIDIWFKEKSMKIYARQK